jgi:uncharacterized membrane protein YphA (DoxX/SURF4 family)
MMDARHSWRWFLIPDKAIQEVVAMDGAQKEQTASVVSLLIRLVVGVVLLFAGIEKWINIIGGSVGYGAFIQGFVDGIKDSWAHNWPFRALIYAFAAVLPWAETSLGLAICVGFRTRAVLVVAAVLLGHLMFGMILQHQHAVVANNGQYVVFAAIAYYFASRGNRYSLDALLAKR